MECHRTRFSESISYFNNNNYMHLYLSSNKVPSIVSKEKTFSVILGPVLWTGTECASDGCGAKQDERYKMPN